MKPVLVSFDGHNINDTTNYISTIPVETPLQAAQARINFIGRAGATPVYAGKEISESYLTITIKLRGTVNDQLETINQWFNVYDETPKQLIIKDTDDSDKQYSIYATPRSISPLIGMKAVKITLARKDPVWKSVSQNSATWTITASADDTAITNNGNIEAYPLLHFKPTSYPPGGWAYASKVLAIPNSLYAWNSRHLEIFGGLDTAALVADATISNQVDEAGNIDDAVTTWTIDEAVGDGLASSGTFYIDTEQCTYTGKTATNIGTVVRGVNGTTAAAHLDNAVMYQSIVMQNGYDLRVLVDGFEVDRWFGEVGTAVWNSSATKCWIVLDMPAKLETKLKVAISDSGTPDKIELTYNAAYKKIVEAMPPTGRVLINDEEFTYSTKTITKSVLELTVEERATRGSVAAAHAIAADVKWIPYDIQYIYGNLSAPEPEIDDTTKPVINLSTSTNASLVYEEFYDTTDPKGLRAGSWKPTLVKTSGGIDTQSAIYYTTQLGADSDPATAMGMKVAAYVRSGVNRAESAVLEWVGSFPDAVSAVTSNGEKYKAISKWATYARLYSSVTGAGGWGIEWSETTPVADTWTAWTHNAEAVVNTRRALKYALAGSTSATAGDYFAFEVLAATITLVNYPTVTTRTAAAGYYIDAIVTNSTTGDFITVKYPLIINQTLLIDCDPNNPNATYSGQVINAVVPNTNRSNWLPLDPGANTLVFTSDSNSDITILVKHYDRMNFI